MQQSVAGVLKFITVVFAAALLCSAHVPGSTTNWRKLCKVQAPVRVKEINFGKGSALSAKQMLMWGEWVISFKRDSLPHLRPYTPVASYADKAFCIDGLQAYSNHNGPALAQIIYDGRTGHKTWDIDIWKPHVGGGVGMPAYHMSFYINGPQWIVVEVP